MNPSRRDVLKTAGVAAGAATGACGLSACSSPEKVQQGPAEIKAAEVPVGGATIIENSAYVVSQPTAGQFRAFNRTCPHASCDVSKVEKAEIICTCHHARFAAADGAVLHGPATTGLTAAVATLEGDTVKVSQA
ncbi:Rieske (2Fe-2S) protein [Luteococcus sp. H138]|uniref:Rieske (2Fe-2S) protein n=1 Tax=unclassified Luteococcus TaxID=2639923 RepID=UPI00313B9E30